MERKVVLYLHIGNKNTEVGLGVLPNSESILSYANADKRCNHKEAVPLILFLVIHFRQK